MKPHIKTHVQLSDPVSLDEAITRALNVDDVSYRNRPISKPHWNRPPRDETVPMEIDNMERKPKKDFS